MAAVLLRYLSEQANLRSGSVVAADVHTDTTEGRRAAERGELRARERALEEARLRAGAGDDRPTAPQRPGFLGELLGRLLG